MNKVEITVFGKNFEVSIANVKNYESVEESYLFTDGSISRNSVLNRLSEIRSKTSESVTLSLNHYVYEDHPNVNMSRRGRSFYCPEIRVEILNGKYETCRFYQNRYEFNDNFVKMTDKDQKYFRSEFEKQTENVDWKQISDNVTQNLEKNLKQSLQDYTKQIETRMKKYRETLEEVLSY